MRSLASSKGQPIAEVSAGIEEEIFYPAFRSEVGSAATDDIILEAEEEHHVHVLIAEIKELLGTSDERFKAKFTVLQKCATSYRRGREGNAA